MARSIMGRARRAVTERHGGRPRVHIRKNDTVKVIAGKSRDKVARVLAVYPDRGLAIVEGVNFVKRHTRPNPSRNIKGGIAEKESPIHVSNLKVVCPECKEAVRTARRVLDDGTKIRICKKCEASIDKTG
ncbi:MAG TPA: 50S ribosomal protein L24 [Candidatus Polarisedimenticolia bacterium]|nr:50S ribosomal protein L24 [Candidatus Polarisedimenticolia bacterium]